MATQSLTKSRSSLTSFKAHHIQLIHTSFASCTTNALHTSDSKITAEHVEEAAIATRGQNRTQTARASTAAAPGRRGREGGGGGESARLESIAAAGPSMVSNVGGRGGERRGGQRTLQPYLECDPKKRAVLARRAKRSTIY